MLAVAVSSKIFFESVLLSTILYEGDFVMQKTLVFILSLGLLFSLTFGAAAYDVEEVNPHTLETSMTIDEIKELEDLSPEEIKKEITLVGDLLNYLDFHFEVDPEGNVRGEHEPGGTDHMWQFPEPAESVIETKTANCVASANLTAFLLEDNYEEVGYFHDDRGFVNTDEPGGHIISYVKEGDNYILFDSQQEIAADTFVFRSEDLEELAVYYAEELNLRYGDELAIVNVIEGEGFHSFKVYSGEKEYSDENMRLRYPYYYEDRAWTAWEYHDDPLFLEFGDGPGFTPGEYREYFRDDEEHYLYTPEANLRQIGAAAAGIAAILLILQ